jgi:hypothetical protein
VVALSPDVGVDVHDNDNDAVEDAKLTRAVPNTSKRQWGPEYMSYWVAIATLVPGRTKKT